MIIMSRSRPAAILVDYNAFDTLLDTIELLKDIADGRRIISEYFDNKETMIDAEKAFTRLSY